MDNGRKAVKETQGIEVRGSSVRVKFTDQHGKRHRIRLTAGGRAIKPSVGNLRSAERLLSDIKAAIHLGTFTLSKFFPDLADPDEADKKTKPIPTLGEQLEHWFSGLQVEGTTKGGYRAAVNFWKSAPADTSGRPLEDVPLNELVFSMIRHAMAVGASRHRRGNVDAENPPKPLKPKTRNNYLGPLNAALNLAISDRLIKDNPASEGATLRSKARLPIPDPFELNELELALAQIREKSDAAADYAEFWAFTGLRTAEMNGLQWSSVNLNRGDVRVKHSLIKGELKERTKTGEARDVPLSQRAREALERQRARTQLAGGFVWTDPATGERWDGDRTFKRSHWAPALLALKIRYRRPYNLRHTRATMLLMSGVTPALAARWLGHDLKMFFERYARWIPGNRDAEQLALVDAATRREPAEIGPTLAQTAV